VAYELAPEDPSWGACEIWPAENDREDDDGAVKPVATMVMGVENAHLIAAAPESHEANQMFVQAINWMLGITADHSDDSIYDEMPSSQLAIAYFAARTAIAKATGAA